VFTALLFGLAPAIYATRIDIVSAVKGAAANTRRGRRLGLSNVLIIAQIGMSLLLLVAAGLFGRTLSNLHSIRLGFNRENVLLFTINPSNASYNGPALMSVYENLRQRLEGIPGVRGVTLSSLPLPTGGGTLGIVTVDGLTPPARNRAGLFSTGPGFFGTMQIPLLAGRDFTEHDRADAPLVAIVNQQFEKTYGAPSATGRTMKIGDTKYEIVGVVSDALFMMLKEDYRPMVYRPYMQDPRPPQQMTFEVRTAGSPLAQAGAVRQIVREFDSRLAVADMKTQSAHIDQAISQEITLARLCAMFAGLALIIACVGLYGMVSFNVAQRIKEIGVRVALGATTRGVIWLVLREVLVLAILGLGLGIPIVFWGSRFVKSLLYGIPPNDAASIALAVLVLLSSGLLAGYLPARRASRIDPTISIRYE
jgi:predicted permease